MDAELAGYPSDSRRELRTNSEYKDAAAWGQVRGKGVGGIQVVGLRRAGRLYQEKSNLEELPGTQRETAKRVAAWSVRGVDGLLSERGATAPTVHLSQLWARYGLS